jgi:hypothetical protein
MLTSSCSVLLVDLAPFAIWVLAATQPRLLRFGNAL